MPYHNATHAADVTCRFMAILRIIGALHDSDGKTKLRLAAACLTAAAMHDLAHPGCAPSKLQCEGGGQEDGDREGGLANGERDKAFGRGLQ